MDNKDWSGCGDASSLKYQALWALICIWVLARLQYDKTSRSTALKAQAAIQAGDAATLRLAMPEKYAPDILRALWLIDRYGTLGGRSRMAGARCHYRLPMHIPPLWKALSMPLLHAIGSRRYSWTGPTPWACKRVVLWFGIPNLLPTGKS